MNLFLNIIKLINQLVNSNAFESSRNKANYKLRSTNLNLFNLTED
jgi:hypothetical protein